MSHIFCPWLKIYPEERLLTTYRSIMHFQLLIILSIFYINKDLTKWSAIFIIFIIFIVLHRIFEVIAAWKLCWNIFAVTHNEEKSPVVERFIGTSKNKISKHMTAVSKTSTLINQMYFIWMKCLTIATTLIIEQSE